MHLLGQIADWCSIVSIPLAIFGFAVTIQQVRQAHRARAATEDRRSWGSMVKFFDTQEKIGITTAYFQDMAFLPRIGERMTLPKSPDGLVHGHYRVVGVHFIGRAKDDSEDAELMNVRIELEPLA